MAKKWIAGAIKHPGKETALAKKAGTGTDATGAAGMVR